MKRSYCTIICLTALAFNSALSQQPPGPTPGSGLQPPPGTPDTGDFSKRLQAIIAKASNPSPEPVLTKFNLDFPGGTPRDLVAAIAKASGRPLNAIVPNDYADWPLPALKMESVDVAQLFKALELASHKQERIGNTPYSSSYGFWTEGNPSANSIWSFNVSKPLLTEKVCRFYSLAPYLDQGNSVDDITTAIETGWKMLGETPVPLISFHKDTKLLIAVGEPSKLETIDAVLKAMGPQMGGGAGGFTPLAPRTPLRPPAPAAK